MSMPMYFQFSDHFPYLFSFWHVSTPSQLYATLAFTFVLAIAYEWLKVVRARAERAASSTAHAAGNNADDDAAALLLGHRHRRRPATTTLAHRLGLAALHLLVVMIGFALMLLVMTYNITLTLTIFAGQFIGYAVFSVGTPTDAECH